MQGLARPDHVPRDRFAIRPRPRVLGVLGHPDMKPGPNMCSTPRPLPLRRVSGQGPGSPGGELLTGPKETGGVQIAQNAQPDHLDPRDSRRDRLWDEGDANESVDPRLFVRRAKGLVGLSPEAHPSAIQEAPVLGFRPQRAPALPGRRGSLVAQDGEAPSHSADRGLGAGGAGTAPGSSPARLPVAASPRSSRVRVRHISRPSRVPGQRCPRRASQRRSAAASSCSMSPPTT